MSVPVDAVDAEVRAAVYDLARSNGMPPTVNALATHLALPPAAVASALERLAEGRALVLQRDSREVLMAPPFSAVATPFPVRAGDRLYYGNCIWDALAIPVVLGTDARIDCSCGCCGEAMPIEVTAGELAPSAPSHAAVVHFAIPAHRWWQDIVFC
jgi:predicted transcriptional regulator